MTMDILWAISHSSNPSASTSGFDPYSSFSMPNPAASNAWDTYDDFVGGVQFWGYGLVSGSGDGAVRMWDSKFSLFDPSAILSDLILVRTGQAHRTLLGHTAPITCLQFDELHIATGSLDQTMRLWDLRTGGVVETMQFDHPVTSLQFDTRKIVAAAGENGVKV
jgi:division protein 1